MLLIRAVITRSVQAPAELHMTTGHLSVTFFKFEAGGRGLVGVRRRFQLVTVEEATTPITTRFALNGHTASSPFKKLR